MALACATCLGLSVQLVQGQEAGERFREELRRRLELTIAASEATSGDELIHTVARLRDFYERRAFVPVWLEGNSPGPMARELVDAILAAKEIGLNPDDYHLQRLEAGIGKGFPERPLRESVDLELLMSDAFVLLASHGSAGRLDPESHDAEWHAKRREIDPLGILDRVARAGSIGEAMAGVAPPQPAYRGLVEALRRYRVIAARGGWPSIAAGPVLKEGMDDPRLEALAVRLMATGDLDAVSGDDAGMDAALVAAVRRFQRRHGLEEDGSVGPETRAALNVSAADRVAQIIVNLERWRWLPANLGERHVLVNIAAFHLDLVDGNAPVRGMRAIVGRDYRRTPVFSDAITYLVLNPFWEVPSNLATSDVLPAIKKDQGYLDQMGFKVLRGWGSDEHVVDPRTIDWSRLSAARFPYRLRQAPGPRNALGRIKFMFPNKFNVYLHDTPARELFARSERALSSGCIRVEKAVELAAWLMQGQESQRREQLAAALEAGSERTVRIAPPVPVHILYWTAWVDDEGALNFRKDVYGRDRSIREALAEPAPEPEGENG